MDLDSPLVPAIFTIICVIIGDSSYHFIGHDINNTYLSGIDIRIYQSAYDEKVKIITTSIEQFFEVKDNTLIAVKIVDDRGIESLKVITVAY
jgi:hypothetical protein